MTEGRRRWAAMSMEVEALEMLVRWPGRLGEPEPGRAAAVEAEAVDEEAKGASERSSIGECSPPPALKLPLAPKPEPFAMERDRVRCCTEAMMEAASSPS